MLQRPLRYSSLLVLVLAGAIASCEASDASSTPLPEAGVPSAGDAASEPLDSSSLSDQGAEGVTGKEAGDVADSGDATGGLLRPFGPVTINTDDTISVGGTRLFPVYIYEMCNWQFELQAGVEPCNPAKNSEFTFSFDPIPFAHASNPAFTHLSDYAKNNINYLLRQTDIALFDLSVINSPYAFAYNFVDEPTDGTEILESATTQEQCKGNNDYGLPYVWESGKCHYPDMRPLVQSSYEKVKTWEGQHPGATTHPVIINVWKDIKLWSAYADILTWDLYTFRDDLEYWTLKDSIYAYEYASKGNAFRELEALENLGKPVWAVLQAHAITDTAGASPVEPLVAARTLTYTALTMNVKGVGFWGYLNWGGSLESSKEYPYGTPGLYNDPARHAYYKQIARELVSLNDILVLPTADYSWHYRSGTAVSFGKTLTENVLWEDRSNFNYLLKTSTDALYLIVVNKDSRPVADVPIQVITLAGVGSKTATTLGLETSGSSRAGRSLAVEGGHFVDSFDGFAVHIYEVR